MRIGKISVFAAAVLAALLLAAPQALAALQVNGFSCNGETGTTNTPNNVAFTCSATINNPDQSTASLGSVKLYIDGTWATQAYDASGFATSLSTGASTTATFVDITPTTPGSHKFAYLLLDGVSDTFVADTVINVMDIRVSKVTANISSAAQNTNFTVTAEISIGGAMSVTTTIDPSDCTLASGEQATKTVGSLTEGSQASVSWKLAMGANDCSYTVSVTGTGSGKVTDDVSGMVSSTGGGGSSPGSTTTSSSSGGGGGGGGGGGASLVSESSLLASVPAGSVATFGFKKYADFAVYEVALTANVNLENAKLTAKEARLSETTPLPTEKPAETVFKYFSVIREKIKNEEISSVKIRFRIPDSFLRKEGIIPETIVLKKLVGSAWVANPTVLLGKSGGYTSYEAGVEGLSTFAIVGEKKEGAAASKQQQEEEKAAEEKAAFEKAAAEAAARREAVEQSAKPEAGQAESSKPIWEKGGFGPAFKILSMVGILLIGSLIFLEVMHFMHKKMPPLNLKLPKIPQPPLSGQKK